MPYEQRSLGLKFNFRIVDLNAADVVVVICEDCHWSSNVAPHVLFARYNKHTKIAQVQKDMVCKGCGLKGGLAWRVETALGPEFPRPA